MSKSSNTKWYHCLVGEDGKLAVVTLGFFLWMIAITFCWTYLTLMGGALIELPTTVVHLTLAMGGIKVTHKLAEHDWAKVLESIVGFFTKKKS